MQIIIEPEKKHIIMDGQFDLVFLCTGAENPIFPYQHNQQFWQNIVSFSKLVNAHC